jgi:hypothetical protein
VQSALRAIFQNAGQTCSAGSRLLLEESIHDRFVAVLAQETERLRLGHGLSDPDLGPIVSEEQLERVLSYLEVGKHEGAKVVTGESRAEEGELKRGFFVRATLFDDVQGSMRIAQEEIFSLASAHALARGLVGDVRATEVCLLSGRHLCAFTIQFDIPPPSFPQPPFPGRSARSTPGGASPPPSCGACPARAQAVLRRPSPCA